MSNWPFNRLHEVGCVVKFGYLSPAEIDDHRAIDGRAAMHREQRTRLVESITEEVVRNHLICS